MLQSSIRNNHLCLTWEKSTDPHVLELARSSITRYSRLGDSNTRKSITHSSGGRPPPTAASPRLGASCLLTTVPSHGLTSPSVCIPSAASILVQRPVTVDGLGPRPCHSFDLNYLSEVLIPKYSQFYGAEGYSFNPRISGGTFVL